MSGINGPMIASDVIQAVAFSAYGAGIISNEHENMIKYTGLHPLVLGRGHNVTESRGPIWVSEPG
jgi:transcription factor C subunit 6